MSAVAIPDLQAHVAAVDNEAGGLLRWAFGMLRAVADCSRAIESAPKRKPSLCLCCPAPLRRPTGLMFCIAAPETEAPHHALGAAICPACAARPDLERRATVAWRQVWPDLRSVEVMPGTGTVQ